jgi:hypothetical protein
LFDYEKTGTTMKLFVSEQDGFKKEFIITKAVTRLGSSPANDIQLRSPKISPFHLQILYTTDAPDRIKAINLSGDKLLLISNGKELSLPTYQPFEVGVGDELRINESRLLFELPLTSGVLSTSPKISASLHLPEPVLRPNAILLGRIALKNEGEQNSCQFQVDVVNLPEDCYQVDPVPLMYTGAQEEINIRLFHRKTRPAAGFQSLTVSITAPDSYPGEQVSIQQGIYVSPFLEQGIEIIDDMPASQPIAAVESHKEVHQEIEQPPHKTTSAQAGEDVEPPIPVDIIPEPVYLAPEPVEVAPEVETIITQDEKPPARLIPVRPKVVRTPAESFWDE